MVDYLRLAASASVCALAMAYCGAAYAQDASEDEGAGRIIVTGLRANPLLADAPTGSRLDLTPLETPATVNAIDGDDIRARGDFDFIDAVTRAPGVTTAASPGNGNTALVMRGFAGQGSVMHLYNGVRLMPNNSSITFPFDTWNVDRIEVLNGPGSVLYGQGALGGVVNVVPKAVNFEQFEFQGQAGYGSFETLHLAAGVGAPISDSLAVRADASYRQSDGYVDRGDSESLALSGAIEFRPNDDFSLTLRHDFGDQQPMRYFGTPLANGERLDTSIRRENYNVADSVMDFRDNRTQLNLDWRPIEGLRLTNATYYLDSYRDWRNLEAYSYDTEEDLVRRSESYGLIHDVQQIGTQTNAIQSSELGGITNQLLVGFEYNYIKLKYSHNFADVYGDAVDPVDFDPGSFLNTVGIDPRYETRTATYALYLEDRIEFSERFSVIGGLRYENDRVGRWNYLYDDTGETIVGRDPALNGGRSTYKEFNDVTWRVGAVYQPRSNLSLFGQYVTGVDPVGNLTSFTTSGEQYAFSNATGHQIEAGVKSVFMDGKGSATVSVYRLVKNDLSVQRVTNGPIEQIGQQSSQGVEATITMELPAGFTIDANGTILDADYDDFPSGDDDFSSNTPQGVPEKAANLTLSWVPADRFRLSGSLRYVGRRFMDNANTGEIPDYVVVDAGGSVAITERLAVDVRVYNLFDKDYALTSSYGSSWILGRPRSFDVALRTSF